MVRLLEPLWLLILNFSQKQLAQTVEYLKEENRILRSKLPKKIIVTETERNRLIKYGQTLGSAINHLITIVHPRTFARWLAERKDGKKKRRKAGRPKIEIDIRETVLKFARENGWGYTKIIGELKKLGVRDICRTTVKNILKSEGFDTGPKRGKGTWIDFIERHTKTLWASDFLQIKTMTTSGFVDFFVLFFIHYQSRRVILGGITTKPICCFVPVLSAKGSFRPASGCSR